MKQSSVGMHEAAVIPERGHRVKEKSPFRRPTLVCQLMQEIGKPEVEFLISKA